MNYEVKIKHVHVGKIQKSHVHSSFFPPNPDMLMKRPLQSINTSVHSIHHSCSSIHITPTYMLTWDGQSVCVWLVTDWLPGQEGKEGRETGRQKESRKQEKRLKVKDVRREREIKSRGSQRDEKNDIFKRAEIEGSRQVSDNTAGVCALGCQSCTHTR